MESQKTLTIHRESTQYRYVMVRPTRSRFDDPFVHTEGRSCQVYIVEDEHDPSKRFLVKRFKDAFLARHFDGEGHPAANAAALIRRIREAARETGDNYLPGDAFVGTDGGDPPVYYHVFPLLNGTRIENVTLLDDDCRRNPTKENLERVLNLSTELLEHVRMLHHDAGLLHNDIKPDNVFFFRVNGIEHVQLLDLDSAIPIRDLLQMSTAEIRDYLERNSSESAYFGTKAAAVYETKDIDELVKLGGRMADHLFVPDITAAAKLIRFLFFGSPTTTMTDEYEEVAEKYPGAALLLRRILHKATYGSLTARYTNAADLLKDLACVPNSLLVEPSDLRSINACLYNTHVLLRENEDSDVPSTSRLLSYDSIDADILPHLTVNRAVFTDKDGQTPLEALMRDPTTQGQHLLLKLH